MCVEIVGASRASLAAWEEEKPLWRIGEEGEDEEEESSDDDGGSSHGPGDPGGVRGWQELSSFHEKIIFIYAY